MKLRELIKLIETKYPLYLKEKWDNIGLMIGDVDKDISKVLVTLDASNNAINEAIENGCDLIISHHPFIFNEMKNVTTKNPLGKKTIKCIKNDIAVYSMHTNLDIADDGLNDHLARKLELTNVEKLDQDKFEDPFMRIGFLNEEMTLKDLTGYVKDKLQLDNVILVSNDDNKKVQKIAICSGAGKSFMKDVLKVKADCFITGDMNYHGALDALDEDINIIDAGHYGTERIVTSLLYEFLSQINEIEVIESQTMINPLKIY